jgi:hypothetical protein
MTAAPTERLWQELTSPELESLRGENPVVLLPIGAVGAAWFPLAPRHSERVGSVRANLAGRDRLPRHRRPTRVVRTSLIGRGNNGTQPVVESRYLSSDRSRLDPLYKMSTL